jgi:hypothetical protein
MRRILFVLTIVVVTVLTMTPPIAAEPLLTPSPPAVLDVGDEALNIAEQAMQTVEWLLGDDSSDDNGDDADDKSERQATASQAEAEFIH